MPGLLENLRTAVAGLHPRTIASAAIYPFRKAITEATWTPSGERRRGLARLLALGSPHPKWPKEWTMPGPVRFVRPIDQGAVLETDRCSIEVVFIAPDLVRVRYHVAQLRSDVDAPRYAIARPPELWPDIAVRATQAEEAYFVQSEALVVGAMLNTARLLIATPDGSLLRADLDGAWDAGGAIRHRVALMPDERIFGLGERATPWDRRGRTHILWNRDPAGYADAADPINLNVPAYLGVLGSPGGGTRTYLAFYDNPTYAEYDLGGTTPEIAEHRFAGGELCYYLAVGTPPDLMARYTELTGRHPLPPLWMLGYHQSRWSYDSEERVRKLARDFQDHNVPCDVIHLDIDYMDGFRCFTWDRGRFPDPKRLSEELREQGIRLISIVDPGVKRDSAYPVYRDGLRDAHFCTTPDGRVFHAPVWPADSAFPDFTAPDTRAWWGDLHRSLLESGIAGIWDDMNEPSAFGAIGDPTLPLTLRHAAEGTGCTHAAIHNVYGMLMARATREGLERLEPDRRPVVITRAGWAGVQRYATSWTADNESTWAGLRLTLPIVLGLGLSGVGFTGPDVGGFLGEPDGELFTRWIQAAAFMPFFRAHTAKGFPDQEPWSYGEPYLSIVRRFIELRYELLPYLYTAVWQMSKRGWPVVRPLAWTDPTDISLWDVDDAYLCGDALLVAPVLEAGRTTRSVRMPSGTWFDFWTNQAVVGGTEVDLPAPLETLPLLVRAGTVLTMGESAPNADHRVQKFLRLGVYLPSGDADMVTELYEDAGEGMAYRSGAFRLSHFVVKQDERTLAIRWEHTGDYNPPYEHVELTLNGLRRVPRAIEVDGRQYAIARADPVRRSAVLGIPRFTDLRVTL